MTMPVLNEAVARLIIENFDDLLLLDAVLPSEFLHDLFKPNKADDFQLCSFLRS